jgi:SNW domain-containing protein 1
VQGYTIPLDKRLAADGRGMQEVTINRKHMGLAQALYAAEETARSETELAARLQYEMKQREKKKKEDQLRQLAANARMGGAVGAHSLASRLDDDGASKHLPVITGYNRLLHMRLSCVRHIW